MLFNADFTHPAVVAVEDYDWVASPQPGVERVMLDRVGTEKARATSVVRYAPGSAFPAHRHPGGEEILVLHGTFVDESGRYPAGWYLRNPPGSMHAPASPDGAVIFVKLWQMDAEDSLTIRLDTTDPSLWQPGRGGRFCPLYRSGSEDICLVSLENGSPVLRSNAELSEVLVVAGEVSDGKRTFAPGSWLRFPPGHNSQLKAGTEGATLYVKSGQLKGPVEEVRA